MRDDSFRRGDVVEVRSPAEILATLDDAGMLEGLPFMPEMLQYFGRRLVVDKRAEKICDTIHDYTSRNLPNTVLLEDLRCDGSGHDGCQAECRLFWKEAWLRKVADGERPPPPFPPADGAALLERASRNTRSTAVVDGRPQTRYRCQNTDLPGYSTYLSVWDP